MTHTSPISALGASTRAGNLFGVPLGNIGWFASLLMATAAGFMAFFGSTFFAIVFILIANTAGHRAIDFTISYRLVGLPIGLIVLAVAIAYMGTLWCRRIFRRG